MDRQIEKARGKARRRQKAYSATAVMSETLNSPLSFDWQLGQGFQSVLALHLHLLIKCHNNMIFKYQQLPLLLKRDCRCLAEAKVRWTAEARHVQSGPSQTLAHSVRAKVIFQPQGSRRRAPIDGTRERLS